ncbi:FUSC family protein [Vulcanococcus sp.]|uniref:FUSC family protein n=1 Tax=Vulcanococcus sp. TaxID=2856995 RepID=UPI0037D99B59
MINRNALRTALTAGLGNGFASITGLPDGQYVALAVLSVSSGTYGTSFELGRQRLLGTVLGSVLLLIGFECLHGLPIAVGLAITLGCLRLLGGLLSLKVGYKVGGMIVVMGWLVHEGNLASWIPLRFFWTALGVVLTVLSLRLFWPARGIAQCLGRYGDLMEQLQHTFTALAQRLEPQPAAGAAPAPAARFHQLRATLQNARSQRPALLQELGNQPQRHPAVLLVSSLDAAASRLVTMVGGMERAVPPERDPNLVARLHQAEAELLERMAAQVGIWSRQLRSGGGLPSPPPQELELPRSWLDLGAELNDPLANSASLERLERIATRLVLCRQAEQAIRDGENSWRTIMAKR